jgi:hypothetical protein
VNPQPAALHVIQFSNLIEIKSSVHIQHQPMMQPHQEQEYGSLSILGPLTKAAMYFYQDQE